MRYRFLPGLPECFEIADVVRDPPFLCSLRRPRRLCVATFPFADAMAYMQGLFPNVVRR